MALLFPIEFMKSFDDIMFMFPVSAVMVEWFIIL